MTIVSEIKQYLQNLHISRVYSMYPRKLKKKSVINIVLSKRKKGEWTRNKKLTRSGFDLHGVREYEVPLYKSKDFT